MLIKEAMVKVKDLFRFLFQSFFSGQITQPDQIKYGDGIRRGDGVVIRVF
jgi:hypothetical protein